MELQFERRAPRDRRNHLTSPRFPFVDGEWKIISANRRIVDERRNEDIPIDEEQIVQLMQKLIQKK